MGRATAKNSGAGDVFNLVVCNHALFRTDEESASDPTVKKLAR